MTHRETWANDIPINSCLLFLSHFPALPTVFPEIIFQINFSLCFWFNLNQDRVRELLKFGGNEEAIQSPYFTNGETETQEATHSPRML